ncbi:MAG: hydrogenase expression/formation protein HypE [Campylobacterota bacterium]|nr:hydrogenase expression/formation protein HypE [Campylobacterota bacterium]
MKRIQLSHGGGGEEMDALIRDLFYRHFSNDTLLRSEDAAVLEINGKIAFTTDSYTVTPLFFNGGDIGKIAVAGTLNDLAMIGARPLYLSCAFIIEEGLPYETLERIVLSMKEELSKGNAKIVCGDTKVVPKGSVDQLFINTSGIGEIVLSSLSAHNIQEDDILIVSRDIGAHGATILASREGIDIESALSSDCATLWPVVEALIADGIRVHAMRDATRGGMAAVLNEWAGASEICLEIEENSVPIRDEVRGICELLGMEPFEFANEGTFILAIHPFDAQRAIDVLHRFQMSTNAAIIGRATTYKAGRVILKSAWGSSRYLERPKGELLPRIC